MNRRYFKKLLSKKLNSIINPELELSEMVKELEDKLKWNEKKKAAEKFLNKHPKMKKGK